VGFIINEIAMKKIKYQLIFLKISALCLLISTLFFSCSSSKKIEKLDNEEITGMLNSQRFVFVAERVNPLRGSSRILTSSYDVTVKNDTLNCYLPYFGQAFQVPYNSTKSPLEFKSFKFNYNIKLNSKDDWQVYIIPTDHPEVQQLIFEIFGNGTATLNIQNLHSDPISFYGHIEKVKD